MANEGVGSDIAGGNSIYKAIVTDVITDPRQGSNQTVEGASIENENQLAGCPVNTCIVNFYGSSANETVVAYPFFPPHIAVPVKPGEAVWVISPALEKPKSEDCYWVCRISTGGQSNDLNFSHPYRGVTGGEGGPRSGADAQRLSEQTKQQPKQEGEESNSLPTFMNSSGAGPILSGEEGSNPFATLYEAGSANALIIKEPTPLFYKRPGDLALQGSNNTLIWFGLDRGHTMNPDKPEITPATNSATTAPEDFSGTIDIVAGRCRYLPTDPKTNDAAGSQPERTAFRTVENEFARIERDTSKPDQGLAGDLDFAVDASRVYVSMKTNGDKNFALNNEFDRMPAGIITGSIQPVTGSAYIVAKSDEIRLIARKQLENEYFVKSTNPEINGSIKIIKEGKKDEDLAAVILQPDGTIQISGSRIFLGRHPDDGGLEESEAGPEDAIHVQPYVRYQQLEDLLNALLDNIDAFCNTLNTHVTPGYGNPSPQILDAAGTLKSDVASRREEIVTLKSTRIFGE